MVEGPLLLQTMAWSAAGMLRCTTLPGEGRCNYKSTFEVGQANRLPCRGKTAGFLFFGYKLASTGSNPLRPLTTQPGSVGAAKSGPNSGLGSIETTAL